MKKLVIITISLLVGMAANPLHAQKKGNKVVCFKSNMDCANCEKTINDYLRFEKGVKDLTVDYATNTIKVEYKEGKNTDEDLAKAIKKKGYTAEKISIDDYKKIVAGTQSNEQENQ